MNGKERRDNFLGELIRYYRPRGHGDILDPCTERATRCKKHTFNCKYRINQANLVVFLTLNYAGSA